MLDLEAQDNFIEIADKRLESIIRLKIRRPTTKELFLYRANKIVREGKRIISRTHLVRQEYGRAVLIGLEKNPALVASGKPISSESEDPDYRSDWKELIARGAPEYIDIVAQSVFESVQEKPENEEGLTFEIADAVEDQQDEVVEEQESPLAN